MASNVASLHDASFDDLPDWQRVWNKPEYSRCEGLGRLVLLTPERVTAAAACIKSGRRVCLNWDLTKLEIANFGRQPCQHHIIPLEGGTCFDDVFIFNPQQSSQWDGLRHYSQPSPDDPSQRVFYGGVKAAEIMDRSSTRIGMQHWAREGICGRGVLLDYARYAEKHSISYSTFSDHAVPLSVLLDIAKEQNTKFEKGDVLFFRMGLIQEWSSQMTDQEKHDYAKTTTPQHAGVEGTEEMLRWIWDSGFAAVASDNSSFEVYPAKKAFFRADGQDVEGLLMHETLLAGWGMPIGELFDLDGLSNLCDEEKRWEFFVASSPLNMPGGVSSPPNCVAIF